MEYLSTPCLAINQWVCKMLNELEQIINSQLSANLLWLELYLSAQAEYPVDKSNLTSIRRAIEKKCQLHNHGWAGRCGNLEDFRIYRGLTKWKN